VPVLARVFWQFDFIIFTTIAAPPHPHSETFLGFKPQPMNAISRALKKGTHPNLISAASPEDSSWTLLLFISSFPPSCLC